MGAWGVLAWEMLAGCRAWAALNYGQVINAVAIEGCVAPPGARMRGIGLGFKDGLGLGRSLQARPCWHSACGVCSSKSGLRAWARIDGNQRS